MRKRLVLLLIFVMMIGQVGALHQTGIANHFKELHAKGIESARSALKDMQSGVHGPTPTLTKEFLRDPGPVHSIVSSPGGTFVTYYTSTEETLKAWLGDAPQLDKFGYIYYDPFNPLTGTMDPAYREASGTPVYNPRTINTGDAPYHQELVDMLRG